MAEYLFGSGTVIAKRTDVTNTMPALLGVLQDISLDFSRTIEDLQGQFASPVAFGGGALKITGKAKFGRFQATQVNNLFLNGTQTASAGLQMAVAEAATSATTSFTVSHGATFSEDLGLFYANTGVQLQPVPSGATTGQYVPGAAGVGTYTIAAGDENTALLVYYSYTVTSDQQIVLANPLMGPLTNFELFVSESFTVFGVVKKFNLKLNNCVSEKLSLGFNNAKFTIPEMDIRAGADAANNILTLSMTE